MPIDTTPPAPPILNLGPGVAGGATAAEAQQPPGVVTVRGTEPGTTIAVTFTNGAHTVTKTVPGQGFDLGVSLTAGEVASLTDGTISVSAIQTDAAGNPSTPATTSFVLDTVVPTTPVVTLGTGVAPGGATAAEAQQASGVVTVSAEAGTTITVNFNNGANPNVVHKSLTATGSAQAVSLSLGDISFLGGNGNITVGAVAKDAAGNSSSPGIAFFTLDTLPPFPGSLLVAPGNQLVDNNEVTHVSFQASGVELGGSGTATFTDGASHSVSIPLLSGTTNSFVNLTGFGRNVTSSLTVFDAAGNSVTSAGNPPVIIVATTPDLVLLISEYNSISKPEWQGNPAYTSVTVKDLPSNFALLTGADLASMAGQGVTAIASSSGNLALTVDQYTHLGGISVGPPAKIVDTAAHIDAMTSGQFGGLAANNIKAIQSTTTPLVLNLDQFNNLNGVALPSDKSTTLQDSEAAIEGLTSGQIAALAAGNIGHINVSGNVLNLGLDQFSALGTAVLDPAIALTVTGTGANDSFTFSRQPFSASDKVTGGAGTDTLSLQGNYGTLAFAADTISGVEKIKANGGGGLSYTITENDGNVATGQTLTVIAGGFGAGDSLVFDGSAETDGSFSFTGGAAGSSTFTGGNKADTFTAGAGADTIRYTSALQSNSTAYDRVDGFDAAADRFSWTHALTFDGTVVGQLRSNTFEQNITDAFTGVAANHAKVFQATSGNMAGQMFLLINDGSVGYSTGDLIVRLTNQTGTLTNSNFTT